MDDESEASQQSQRQRQQDRHREPGSGAAGHLQVDLSWIVFESQRAHLRERLKTPDHDGPCPSSSFEGALWIARREFQLKSAPREAV